MQRKLEHKHWSWLLSSYMMKGMIFVVLVVMPLLWMKQLGLSNSRITFCISGLLVPFVLRPFFFLLVNHTYTFRRWIIMSHAVIAILAGLLAYTLRWSSMLPLSLSILWIMAFFSVIYVDALENMPVKFDSELPVNPWILKLAAFMGVQLVGQGVMIMMAGNLQLLYRNGIRQSWSMVGFAVMGLLTLLLMWNFLTIPTRRRPVKKTLRYTALSATAQMIYNYFRKNVRVHWPTFLFLLVYPLPCFLVMEVIPLFLVDSPSAAGYGLSPQEYALIVGSLGVFASGIGAFLGTLLVDRWGMVRSMWPMAVVMTLSTMVYVVLSRNFGMNFLTLNLMIAVQMFGLGFGIVLWIAVYRKIVYQLPKVIKSSYLALMAMAVMIPGIMSGWLQVIVGYQQFFLIAMASGGITLLGVAGLYHRLKDED